MTNYYKEAEEWLKIATMDSDRIDHVVMFAVICALLDISERLDLIHAELGNIRRKLEAME